MTIKETDVKQALTDAVFRSPISGQHLKWELENIDECTGFNKQVCERENLYEYLSTPHQYQSSFGWGVTFGGGEFGRE